MKRGLDSMEAFLTQVGRGGGMMENTYKTTYVLSEWTASAVKVDFQRLALQSCAGAVSISPLVFFSRRGPARWMLHDFTEAKICAFV